MAQYLPVTSCRNRN